MSFAPIKPISLWCLECSYQFCCLIYFKCKSVQWRILATVIAFKKEVKLCPHSFLSISPISQNRCTWSKVRKLSFWWLMIYKCALGLALSSSLIFIVSLMSHSCAYVGLLQSLRSTSSHGRLAVISYAASKIYVCRWHLWALWVPLVGEGYQSNNMEGFCWERTDR